MLNDQDMAIMWPELFSRLTAVKVDLELLHPGIERIAPEDPRIFEVECSEMGENSLEFS